MRVILVSILIIGLFSCTKTTEDQSSNNDADSIAMAIADSASTPAIDYESLFKLESYLTSSINNENTDIIDYDCAILVYPTDEQIEEMKKEEGEENFLTIADDAEFYQGTAVSLIDSVGIRTMQANKQFLRLKGQEKTWDLDIRKKNLPEWNIIFFSTTKEPQIISAINVTVEQINEYFKTK